MKRIKEDDAFVGERLRGKPRYLCYPFRTQTMFASHRSRNHDLVCVQEYRAKHLPWSEAVPCGCASVSKQESSDRLVSCGSSIAWYLHGCIVLMVKILLFPFCSYPRPNFLVAGEKRLKNTAKDGMGYHISRQACLADLATSETRSKTHRIHHDCILFDGLDERKVGEMGT